MHHASLRSVGIRLLLILKNVVDPPDVLDVLRFQLEWVLLLLIYNWH